MSDEKKPKTDNEPMPEEPLTGGEEAAKAPPEQPVEPPPLPKDTPPPEVKTDENFDGFDDPPKAKTAEGPRPGEETDATWTDVPPGFMGAAVLPIQELFRRFRRRGGRGKKKVSPRVLMIAELARAVRANADAIKSVAEVIDGSDVDDGNTHIVIDREIVEDLSRELRMAAAGFMEAMQTVKVNVEDTAKEQAAGATGPVGPSGSEQPQES